MKNTSILLSGFWWYAKHSGSTAMHASAAVPVTPAQMADMASSSAYAKITTAVPAKDAGTVTTVTPKANTTPKIQTLK